MAKSPPKITSSVTPGQNAPVKNVIKFEDLVQHVKRGAAKPVGSRAGARAAPREELNSIQRIAADLEKRLRAIRAATADKPAAPAARRARSRKRKS